MPTISDDEQPLGVMTSCACGTPIQESVPPDGTFAPQLDKALWAIRQEAQCAVCRNLPRIDYQPARRCWPIGRANGPTFWLGTPSH